MMPSFRIEQGQYWTNLGRPQDSVVLVTWIDHLAGRIALP